MGKAVRLDKFLADSGAGTRTDVKKLIQKGMVQVNGEKVKKPELKVDPENDVVELGGERLGARAGSIMIGTAPILESAKNTITKEILFGSCTSTLSPFKIPLRRKAAARQSAFCFNSI